MVLNFISRLAAKTRSSMGVVSIVNRAKIILSHRSKSIHHRGAYNNIIKRIRAASSIAELRSILAEEKNKIYIRGSRNRMAVSLSKGLEIASNIIEDGLANGIYSPKSYSVFLQRRKTRGVLNALWDKVVDIAKHNAEGAVGGFVVAGPDGAVAGAMDASSVEVAETAFDLVTGGAEPAH